MARSSKVLLGVWLTWMLASASAFATQIPLGNITPGSTSFRTFGAPATPGVAFDDQFGFNVVGSDGAFAASVISQEVASNGDVSLFNITAQLFGWDSTSSSFKELTTLNTPNPAVVLPATNLFLKQATGGDPGGINFAYYLEVKGTPTAGAGSLAGYGGSMNIVAVPEPSSLLLLLGGTICVAFLGRRRLNPQT